MQGMQRGCVTAGEGVQRQVWCSSFPQRSVPCVQAAEERQLQIAARNKIKEEERKRKEALDELFAKMKSKQKIGESIAADVNAIARAVSRTDLDAVDAVIGARGSELTAGGHTHTPGGASSQRAVAGRGACAS